MVKNILETLAISKITDNIYLSGVTPLKMPNVLQNLKIDYVLSCISEDQAKKYHASHLKSNPNLKIMYLPYDDIVTENLWKMGMGVDVGAGVGVGVSANANAHSNIEPLLKHTKLDKLKSIYNLNMMPTSTPIPYGEIPLIEVGYKFIDEAVTNNKRILIHCVAGISRSVSLIIYFLMKKYGISFDDALMIIKHGRTIANPNRSFKIQLLEYSKQKEHFTFDEANNIIKNFL